MLGIFLGPERDCKYVDAPGCPTGQNLFCTPYIYSTYIYMCFSVQCAQGEESRQI